MNFIGLDQSLQARVLEALKFLKVDGISEEIEVVQLGAESENCLEIARGAVNAIKYKEKHHFFRALSLYVQLSSDFTTTFERTEKAYFEQCGPMIDCSRNAMYKVATLKELLLKMALMGHNNCMLYTEDTYEIEEYQYFGYLRGKYLKEELKELDDYADSLGIEMIPCIQALAHLNQTFRWDYIRPMIDIDDILLVGEEKTYELVENMMKALRGVFRSNQIHIGMDEAYALGRGHYLDKNGAKHHFDIMIEHLDRVVDIAKKYDFKPMIWDDMFQRSHEGGYDTQMTIDPAIVERVPAELSLVYWDYYQQDPARYDFALTTRQAFNNPIVFAGGIWKWAGLVPSYEKTMATTNASLGVCKKHGIKQIIATIWGDDGSEIPLGTTVMGMILFAEHTYGETVDEAWLEERCKFLTGLSVADFMAMENVDLLPMIQRPNYGTVNPSKTFLYQDILLGAFDKHAEGLDIKPHYEACIAQYNEIAQRAGEYSYIYELYRDLCKVLVNKYDLGLNLRAAYLAGDKEKLQAILNEVFPILTADLAKYNTSFRKAWHKESKGQGFEIIDIRLGGIKARLTTAAIRIQQYIDGEIDAVE
ncbi:MAG: beta-N-acetylhexosaminidase, partial [Cellulosilyticaceae bacterium]